MKTSKPKLLCIMGPTASGKTDLALQLAKRIPCEIISVDSAMVYRGMDIGTAKPLVEQRLEVSHHLIDICDPAEKYSAGLFCRDAHRAIQAILQRGRIPLLVGGTMLYFRAFQYGLALLPVADDQIREQITEEAKHYGWPRLHERLQQIDPTIATKINPNDGQRIQRALEVYILTGKPLTELQQQTPNPHYAMINVALVPSSRPLLHERIAKRFHDMLQQDFLGEVEKLFKRGDLQPDLPSMRAVGYRQAWQYLAGELSYKEMEFAAITATRQLAKHQLTWLRQWPDKYSCEAESSGLVDKVLGLINVQ